LSAASGTVLAALAPLANGMPPMYSHWIFTLGSKACAWTGVLAARIWPQTPCNAEETWNMGLIIVSAIGLLAVLAVYRRLDAWHNYYRD
jgi:hypothetical protein